MISKKRHLVRPFFKDIYARKSFNLLSQAHTISVPEIWTENQADKGKKGTPIMRAATSALYKSLWRRSGNTNYFLTFLSFISMFACQLSF